MAKFKSKSAVKAQQSSGLPLAPWIYINDTTASIGLKVAQALVALVPLAAIVTKTIESDPASSIISVHQRPSNEATLKTAILNASKASVVAIYVETNSDLNHATWAANFLREAAIKRGNNFTSINLSNSTTHPISIAPEAPLTVWGTNHLDLDMADMKHGAAADKIFKWLCKAN